MALTFLQAKALAFIADFYKREGAPPTRRQLCEHMGWNAPATGQRMVEVLVRKGVIEPWPVRHGFVRLTKLGESVLSDRLAA